MEWLFRSDFDTPTVVALWSIVAVAVTTLVLFVYTLGLRFATLAGMRRRRRLLAKWRDVFGEAMLSAKAASEIELPVIGRTDRVDLLEEWNRARSMVDGAAADHLTILARRTKIPEFATQLIHKTRIRSKILAVQTFGHLRDATRRDEILDLVAHKNTALSVTAAAALMEIEPDRAVQTIIPLIAERRDWPKNRVSQMLRLAGSGRISEPMYRIIRSADDETRTYLLQFARLTDAEVLDALVEDLLRSSNDPGVLTAALKLVSGFGGVPRIAWLTQHDAWFVRMQAAKILGRIGQQEHVSLLETLLGDTEWWVRYRAAQSLVSLPFLGPNKLRALKQRQKDRFARDILQHAFAEVGLA